MPPNLDRRPCSIPGCNAWAIRDSEPPICAPHAGRTGALPGNANALVHGYYAGLPSRAGQAGTPGPTRLDEEIRMIRTALRRLEQMLLDGTTLPPDPRPLTADEVARFAGLVFQGAGAVSRLLRRQAALSGSAFGFVPQFAAMLAEPENRWDVGPA